MSKKNRIKCGNVGNVGSNGYDMKAGIEALNRAGQSKNLHGNVFEIMYKDAYNANPGNILSGKTCQLTKSPTAQMKDAIMMKGNKVCGHVQLKDTAGSISKTAKQINSGHYGKTRIYGTTETAAKAAGKTKQVVHDSGISSTTTKRIADKALGKMPSAGAVSAAAKAGGVTGAVVSAGIETVCSIGGVISGEKDVVDAACDITYAGVKGGAAGYAGAAAGAVAAGATGAAITASGIGAGLAAGGMAATAVACAPAVAAFGAACGVGSIVCDVFDSIFDW